MKGSRKKGDVLLLSSLLVVRPHSDHLNHLGIVEHLVDESMLNVDPPGVGPRQIAHQFFVGRRRSIWVRFDDIEKRCAWAFSPEDASFLGSFLACCVKTKVQFTSRVPWRSPQPASAALRQSTPSCPEPRRGGASLESCAVVLGHQHGTVLAAGDLNDLVRFGQDVEKLGELLGRIKCTQSGHVATS